MKKVLSVAMASAMVLGMGANAFAITYNSGSTNTADWPSNFAFEGSLFVTDKNGDIVEQATTDINSNKAVDFEDMINESARLLNEVKEMKQKLDFKYIIVDRVSGYDQSSWFSSVFLRSGSQI